MTFKLWLWLMAIGVAGCVTNVPPSQTVPTQPGLDIVIHVEAHSPPPQVRLTGVEVTGVTRDGTLLSFGTTFGGTIRLSKARLSKEGTALLLFCHPLFQCGARKVEEDRLLEYDELWVDLSPVILR